MLDKAKYSLSEGLTRTKRKVAFSPGSSKHGNALLAFVGANNDEARNLKQRKMIYTFFFFIENLGLVFRRLRIICTFWDSSALEKLMLVFFITKNNYFTYIPHLRINVFHEWKLIHWNRDITYLYIKRSLATPDHLSLDKSPDIGPLISRWELDIFKNCWNKSLEPLKSWHFSFSNARTR
jgi:hypothetical protein